jgi:hypothetical protein
MDKVDVMDGVDTSACSFCAAKRNTWLGDE